MLRLSLVVPFKDTLVLSPYRDAGLPEWEYLPLSKQEDEDK